MGTVKAFGKPSPLMKWDSFTQQIFCKCIFDFQSIFFLHNNSSECSGNWTLWKTQCITLTCAWMVSTYIVSKLFHLHCFRLSETKYVHQILKGIKPYNPLDLLQAPAFSNNYLHATHIYSNQQYLSLNDQLDIIITCWIQDNFHIYFKYLYYTLLCMVTFLL